MTRRLALALVMAAAVGLGPALAQGPGKWVIAGAFTAAARGSAEALLLVGHPMFSAQRARIAELAARGRLPVMASQREYAEAGSLMAYGANLRESYRRAAGYVDKILKGARPGALPVEEPTKFELVVNMKTAKGAGVDDPSGCPRAGRRDDPVRATT